jgi:hypothetical protein
MLARWREQRALRARASAYVTTLFAEPPSDDVRWLAVHGAREDTDHARWELRYLRRALGLLTAQRDALDDRTASVVAHELARALGRDPAVAPGKLKIVERQLNARLRGYADALTTREGAGTGWHLGRALLGFAGRRESAPPEIVAGAGDLAARYLTEVNEALRKQFGEATSPRQH